MKRLHVPREETSMNNYQSTMSASRSSSDDKISHHSFYGEFHGHLVSDLQLLYPHLRSNSESLIWTAGDSSLDNKYWFRDSAPAVEGVYADLLRPPHSIKDVTFWMNQVATERNMNMATINTAVEATTLNERSFGLRAQDEFIRDNMQPEDTLVVSIGGNDVALLPMPCTIVSMCGLLTLPTPCIDRAVSCGAVPVDDCCCGCGASLVSCLCSCPPCFGYFRHLFGFRVENYIRKLTRRSKPKQILVCMIYYPDEHNTPSWANTALGALGYNKDPAKLQAMIRKTFVEATSNIKIDGSTVIPVPLFHVLDGKTPSDFVARVEPSAEGGRKMAEYFLDIIETRRGAERGDGVAVGTQYIQERS